MDDLSGADLALISDCLEELRLEPHLARGGQRLSGGSGSAVYRLDLAQPDRSVVLKVTTEPDWRARAEREGRFLTALGKWLPVDTPCVLGMAISARYVCVLQAAARPTPAPARWSRRRWIEVATRLGTLHHAETLRGLVTTDHGLPRRTPAPPPELIAPGIDYWRRVGRDALARSVSEQSDLLVEAVTTLPDCLLHGDFHAENLLLDQDDRLLFSDWQEVGIGHGPEDLVFLWQRAEADGARPPREQMLRAYAAARGHEPTESLRRAMLAAELLLLLAQWPPFLAVAGPTVRDGMTRRLDLRVAEWHGARQGCELSEGGV